MSNQLELEYGLQDIQDAANWLLNHFKSQKIWLFDAQVGSGKTTLITQILKQLGVQHVSGSPTFSIVNQYFANQKLIIHADLYRLKSTEELIDLGFEDQISEADFVCIEWPQLVLPMLFESYVLVHIKTINQTSRLLTASIFFD